MLKAIKDNKVFYAWETEKEQKPFFCPECKREVGLRKGKIKIHHFYHIKKFDCLVSPESQIHLEIKFKLYKYLKTIYNKVELEYRIGDRISDVFYINMKNKKVVYEVQKSKLSLDEVKKRTESYKNQNIYVIWLLIKDCLKINDWNQEIKLSAWQQYIYKLYGKLFIYHNGIIYEYFLEDTIRETENYDVYGNYYGGYYKLKTIKHIKNVRVNKKINILY